MGPKNKITDFEEFQQWVKSVSDSTESSYRRTLERFCEYHDTNPRELIREARQGADEGSETPWLEENPADQRLLDWFNHLTENKGVSKNTGATYWRRMKSFYKKFGVEISEKTPKGEEVNQKPELSVEDVKKMADSAPSLRDRAMIWVGFQGGMNPTEIRRLKVGDVLSDIEAGKCPIHIEKVRKKSSIRHKTWIHRDAIEPVKRYIEERKRKEGELDPENPLFVKRSVRRGGREINSTLVRKVMRKIRDRVGGEIDAVSDHLDQQMNPLSFKFLRKAFGVACDNTDEISGEYKNHWLGHSEPYNGAYSGLTIEKQREKYDILAEKRLNYSAVSEERAGVEELRGENEELRKMIGSQQQRVEELEVEVSKMKELMEIFGDLLEEKPELKEKFQEML
ncbi:hypothetical protein AKJ51_00285 [candidate division MSBL1 archaeon SCGC-AAA382A20]|uniref:Tyr recombinase domain-containing protein n=1 Tax=candidate division MSBL1 archaeon SCGC-AAA382A20 TaxID=1698280 RepID=A0A133VMM0_9EURY|nr:hypothetical protein AKJ51_00285 [candidate division MSBL1 archaeon SCGC-AAA382A20]